MELIIGLLSGAAGGNAAGKLLGSLNQGTLINSIAGVVGGGLGARSLAQLVLLIWQGPLAALPVWTSARSLVRLLAAVLVVAQCLPSSALFAT